MKIALLVVENRDTVLLDYAKTLLKFAITNKIYLFKFWEGKRKPIWFMRREMIRQAMENPGITHVLFIDTDVIPPDDFLEKLLAHEKDIVSGVYFDTQGLPCSIKRNNYFKGEGLCEVDVFSMGLSLLTRKVCEEIIYPDPSPNNKIDADTEFCKLAQEKGYTIYQDFDLRGKHLLLNIN